MAGTIPASALVNVIPGAISAGGAALVMNGLALTQSWRVPIGQVVPFATATAVSAYFGSSSAEYAQAVIYFNGYVNCTQLPSSLLFAQYPQTAVAAWMRSGQISTMTVTQIAAITGSLTLTVDGYSHTVASLNLSSGTSYTSLATVLQTALNTSEPTEAVTTGAIAAGTASFTATIADDIMTVTAVASGTLIAGAVLSGGIITSGTQIVQQISGTTGGIGVYAVSIAQAVPSSTTVTGTYGTMTISAVSSGTVSIGQTVTGTGVTAGTVVTALGTGTGLTGTYYVNLTQTVASETLTLTATNITVTYDSVTGTFVFTSGILGAPSTIAYATGTAAASLLMTAATGAIISQGSAALTPSAFMTGVTLLTQNLVSFWNITDPDDFNGNTNKLGFCAWASAQNSRYVYVCWDWDLTPTTTVPATTSLGYLVSALGNNYGSVYLIFDPTNEGLAAFTAGSIASLNFGATNGRTTFAYRYQSGLPATVTNQNIAANLKANGYNWLGAYATANQNFILMQPGQVSGIFAWLDSFCDQVYMNNQFQLALMNMLVALNSVPYNTQGYASMQSALMSTIQQMINFGAIRPNVPLSSVQALTVNTQAGLIIDPILSTQGWYMQVQAATPQVRQARQSPTFYFWYMDGQSVQQIVLNSIELL